ANLSIARDITILQSSDSNHLATIGTDVAGNFAVSGDIDIAGGYVNLMGSDSGVFILSGAVSGAGGLQEPKLADPYEQGLRLSGTNNYSGGTIIRVGTWAAASNTAFGSGTIWFEGNGETTPIGSIVSFTSARTLANPIVFRANPLFNGGIALTLNGTVDLGSVLREIQVTNTAGVTLGGVISDGGISKTGTGLLILSGNNSYTNQTQVREGILQIRSNNALGSSVGNFNQATYITGSGVLEFGAAVSTPERINFGATGLPITSALATGNLRAKTGESNILNDIGLDDVGTIGVDTNAILNIDGNLLDQTGLGEATLSKVGGGLLTISRARISGVAINGGTVRVRAGSGFEGTSQVDSLTITSGTLDLTHNAFIIDYQSSPLTTIHSYLENGRIISSTGSNWTVGYAEADWLFDTFPNQFGGLDIDITSLLLLGTYGGDTDLDQDVDFADLLKVAQNYDTTGNWTEGDFNYDDTIDFTDLLLVAQNYGLGTINGLTSPEQFSVDWQLARSMANVPEPTSLIMFGFGLIALRRRR
ncbi:MAG TPA: autotransporter-associated beta strand repeat-containing protein, partial [Tepidisphaeraceae bacterium]|nr:autotransporter-associated beta strand repeat-containing protein [Tepidisphaeraceae bacterium]